MQHGSEKWLKNQIFFFANEKIAELSLSKYKLLLNNHKYPKAIDNLENRLSRWQLLNWAKIIWKDDTN
jgi:hypothetical protein